MLGSNNPAARRVRCIDTNEEFDTIRIATEWLHSVTGHGGAISACCRGIKNLQWVINENILDRRKINGSYNTRRLLLTK